MDYNDFLKIKALVAERDQLKKGVTLIQEMTVKGTSLPEFQTRLVFAELRKPEPIHGKYYPVSSWNEMMMNMRNEVISKQEPEWRETGMILLDDILLLHVASVLVDHWDKRIREINVAIKALGIEP
jgi:hypothetical protein